MKFSLISFCQKASQVIQDKTIITLHKLKNKIQEEPTVFRQHRRPQPTQPKPSLHPLSPKKEKKQTLSVEKNQKLGQLLRRKQELLNRLRKIDQELHNPSMLPVTFENNSFLHSQSRMLMGNSNLKLSRGSKIRQNQAYNLQQHQKNLQMLGRINQQKMARQEKIVSEMKKKQQQELEQLQKLQQRKQKQFQIQVRPKINKEPLLLQQSSKKNQQWSTERAILKEEEKTQ